MPCGRDLLLFFVAALRVWTEGRKGSATLAKAMGAGEDRLWAREPELAMKEPGTLSC